MTDDIETFEAASEDTLELTVPDGTTYEFPESHVPYLKAVFESLEIGAVPDLEWSSEDFRERVSDAE